jgi:hypothetical protein
MPDNLTSTARATGTLLALAAVMLALAACGGSSKSSTTSAAASSSPLAGVGGARFSSLRECLKRNGITLPPRTPGQRRPGAGLLGGGGPRQLPSGVTKAQFEAALKKCGAHGLGGGAARLTSPAFRAALIEFGACMREHGIDLPPPNTSGQGPIFRTAGINTTSKAFTGAVAKCRSIIAKGPRLRGGAAPGGE